MLRVVLADDEKKIILLMHKLIHWDKLGYEIVGMANDGLQALKLVREKQPHLLITDIRMPGTDGIELIRRAKEIQPRLHCIVISGYRQFEYAQNALKYGVEDYLLKPLKQEELEAILLRLKAKLSDEATTEFQLQKSEEHRQTVAVAALRQAADRQQPFLSAAQAAEELGLPLYAGYSFAALVKPDMSGTETYPDGYRLLMRHTLEIVRREVQSLTEHYAAAVQREGVAVLLSVEQYQPMESKRCFMKICKEIEKQRDLFRDIHCTVCLGSRKSDLEQLSDSMREALWLCRDRLCKAQLWRDAEAEPPDFSTRYEMGMAQKKRMREAAECLDEERVLQELEDSYREVTACTPLSGQMLADWFWQVLEASLSGMHQRSLEQDSFLDAMDERFWCCSSAQDVFCVLRQNVMQRIRQLREEQSLREARPITVARHYIRQHYQQTLRLEDVSNAVGFNATYFSALFKKETGKNFMEYLTELRIEKSKELLCSDALSVQDVAEQVGYRDLKYFSRLFKKATGVSPSDYKKLYR